MNPFKYGAIVSGKDFCGRKDLLKQIVEYINSSQNIAVFGERRVGKSSAVYEAVRRSKGFRLLYVDLMGIKSIDALCKRILREIVVLEQKSKWFDKMMKTLSYLRPSISLDPITSMPTISFDTSYEMKADSISEVLALIEELDKSKRLVIVFDEFQDMLSLEESKEALALLRSKIQFQSHIPYIFVGSILHKMNEIFITHDSPFYKSAVPLMVGPLPYKDFSEFLKDRFMKGGRTIDEEVMEKVFEIANHIPGDIQQLCEALWGITEEDESIGLDKFKDALLLIFTREQKAYENYMSILTAIQQKCLFAIAKEGGKRVFSVPFLKSAGFNNPSSVRRAITRLVNLHILFESGGEYRFSNPFFRAWLLSR